MEKRSRQKARREEKRAMEERACGKTEEGVCGEEWA
jgi:hypothetical protein